MVPTNKKKDEATSDKCSSHSIGSCSDAMPAWSTAISAANRKLSTADRIANR